MVTRQQIVDNSYKWHDETVRYSMDTTNSPTGHRPDCSGYVSMCLGITPPGLSTVSLPYVSHHIEPDELLPGDMLGMMGPGTGGANGHVQLFINHTQTGLFIAEQSGGLGPYHHTIKRIDPTYQCWRFNDIEIGDSEVLTNDQNDLLRLAAARAFNASALMFAFADGADDVSYQIAFGDDTGVTAPTKQSLLPFWQRLAREVIKQLDLVADHTHIAGEVNRDA